MLLESSIDINSNSGTINLRAPETFQSSQNYRWISKGTSVASAASQTGSYPAPTTNVLCGIGDISGDNSILRVDGSLITQTTEDQGTGNFLAYPLYIGRRRGSSLPFNGRIYGLVLRFGANLGATTIDNAEAYIAAKTGVTL
jgi:hypothetical protein